ncbi:MAG: diphthamide biosynthesis enzyme Dph2 [Candidatus Nezhaarchaeales archaeon]
MYDLRVNDVAAFIDKQHIKKVLLQFADGLKQYSCYVYEELGERKPNVEVYLSGSSCYGACDVAFDEAVNIGVNGIVHYGHTSFPESFTYADKLGVKLLFVEAFSRVDISKALDKALDIISSMGNVTNVGLTASLQEIPQIPIVKQLLEREGYQVHVGIGSDRVKYPGQVLGCDYTSALLIKDSVETFLHIGGGLFHAIGLSIAVQKPVVLCDPYRSEARDVESEARRVKAVRLHEVLKVMDEARHFCIVVGCKWRQRHVGSAMKIKRLLERKGKKANLMMLYEVTPQTLENVAEPDAFVITACPRIPIDDYMNYRRPILTVLEALIVAGELKLEEWSLCDWTFNEKAARTITFKGR